MSLRFATSRLEPAAFLRACSAVLHIDLIALFLVLGRLPSTPRLSGEDVGNSPILEEENSGANSSYAFYEHQFLM